jgi:hypothetical protein
MSENFWFEQMHEGFSSSVDDVYVCSQFDKCNQIAWRCAQCGWDVYDRLPECIHFVQVFLPYSALNVPWRNTRIKSPTCRYASQIAPRAIILWVVPLITAEQLVLVDILPAVLRQYSWQYYRSRDIKWFYPRRNFNPQRITRIIRNWWLAKRHFIHQSADGARACMFGLANILCDWTAILCREWVLKRRICGLAWRIETV